MFACLIGMMKHLDGRVEWYGRLTNSCRQGGYQGFGGPLEDPSELSHRRIRGLATRRVRATRANLAPVRRYGSLATACNWRAVDK
jgi:hypothetical protein